MGLCAVEAVIAGDGPGDAVEAVGGGAADGAGAVAEDGGVVGGVAAGVEGGGFVAAFEFGHGLWRGRERCFGEMENSEI